MRVVRAGNITIGDDHPLVLIAGPCVIESREHCHTMAIKLRECAMRHGIP